MSEYMFQTWRPVVISMTVITSATRARMKAYSTTPCPLCQTWDRPDMVGLMVSRAGKMLVRVLIRLRIGDSPPDSLNGRRAPFIAPTACRHRLADWGRLLTGKFEPIRAGLPDYSPNAQRIRERSGFRHP
jgi:hypothetical protein